MFHVKQHTNISEVLIMTKKIFSKQLAYELRLRGFKILGIEPNRKKPQLDVYIFQESKELETAMGEILANRA